MKNILAAIAFTALSFSAATAQQSGTARHTWTLKITPDSPRTYLDSVAKSWRVNHIMLTFTTLQYNAQGKLVKIKGTVISAPGKGAPRATFTSDNLESYVITVTNQPSVEVSGK